MAELNSNKYRSATERNIRLHWRFFGCQVSFHEDSLAVKFRLRWHWKVWTLGWRCFTFPNLFYSTNFKHLQFHQWSRWIYSWGWSRRCPSWMNTEGTQNCVLAAFQTLTGDPAIQDNRCFLLLLSCMAGSGLKHLLRCLLNTVKFFANSGSWYGLQSVNHGLDP